MRALSAEILLKAKGLLGLRDATQDSVLKLTVELVLERILAYCKLDALPEGLKYTAAEMAASAFKQMQGGNVQSVKRGDVTVNFSAKTVYEILDGYTGILNSYRRARPMKGG